VSSEQLLVMMLKRAQVLTAGGAVLFATPALSYFLEDTPGKFDSSNRVVFLDQFARLDDNDILTSAKVWCNHPDAVLSLLSSGLVNRHLFSVELDDDPFETDMVEAMRGNVAVHLSISDKETEYLVISDSVSNYAYSDLDDRISILDKKGNILDIAEASDMLNISVLSKTIRKYFLCYPRFMKELKSLNH
ncbi:MAG: phosphohydrolase, partial [Bacteroidales bacterium]|nr:phosphohydrolase [Bacteroidales bacterium]